MATMRQDGGLVELIRCPVCGYLVAAADIFWAREPAISGDVGEPGGCRFDRPGDGRMGADARAELLAVLEELCLALLPPPAGEAPPPCAYCGGAVEGGHQPDCSVDRALRLLGGHHPPPLAAALTAARRLLDLHHLAAGVSPSSCRACELAPRLASLAGDERFDLAPHDRDIARAVLLAVESSGLGAAGLRAVADEMAAAGEGGHPGVLWLYGLAAALEGYAFVPDPAGGA